MKKAVPLIISLLMILSAVYAQHAETPGKQECQHKQEIGEMRRLEMLDLTDEQQEMIHSVKIETRKQIIPLRAEIELKELELRNEMVTDSPNRNTIMKLAEDISDIELQIKQTKLDERLKLHSILTPEQRRQIKKMPRKMIQKKIIKRHSDDL